MWVKKKEFNDMKIKIDALVDPMTARGSSTDKTTRLIGNYKFKTNQQNLGMYIANGFVQNIVDQPAEDATREWIEVSAVYEDVENQEIQEMVEDRIKELGIQEQIKNLIRYARLYSKGSFLYYGITAHQIQQGSILALPMPKAIKAIEFINVIDNPDKVIIQNLNKNNPTERDYNQMRFTIAGQEIHPSRLTWLVNSLIPSLETGLSIVQIINDAIVAQDSALWSTNSILMAMAVRIFKSDAIANLNITQKAELLAKIKHLMDTQSVFSLMQDESFEMLTFKIEGMKELFDFIFDNLAGLSRIPKLILLGKAHGVVTAGEFDTINYYAQIAKFQENDIRPIIEKIIDLIVREERGEIWKAVNGDIENLKVEFEFNSLWKLDPISQADVDLKNSQRDQIEITLGKSSPEELRDIDSRYKGLEPFVMDRNFPPDLEEPEIVEPDDEDEPDVPIEKEVDEE